MKTPKFVTGEIVYAYCQPDGPTLKVLITRGNVNGKFMGIPIINLFTMDQLEYDCDEDWNLADYPTDTPWNFPLVELPTESTPMVINEVFVAHLVDGNINYTIGWYSNELGRWYIRGTNSTPNVLLWMDIPSLPF